MALAPLVAPLIGGVLQTVFGWRSTFVALLCVGTTALLTVWFLLPETLAETRAGAGVASSMLRVLSRRFLGDRDLPVHHWRSPLAVFRA